MDYVKKYVDSNIEGEDKKIIDKLIVNAATLNETDLDDLAQSIDKILSDLWHTKKNDRQDSED